jgi:hypothetical protein
MAVESSVTITYTAQYGQDITISQKMQVSDLKAKKAKKAVCNVQYKKFFTYYFSLFCSLLHLLCQIYLCSILIIFSVHAIMVIIKNPAPKKANPSQALLQKPLNESSDSSRLI